MLSPQRYVYILRRKKSAYSLSQKSNVMNYKHEYMRQHIEICQLPALNVGRMCFMLIIYNI